MRKILNGDAMILNITIPEEWLLYRIAKNNGKLMGFWGEEAVIRTPPYKPPKEEEAGLQ